MTTIGYIFLDANREALVPLERQRQALEGYARTMGLSCDELLVEESYPATVPLGERKEGAKLVEQVPPGSTILVMQASWVLCSAKEALRLLTTFKERSVSLYCVDLDGDLVQETERKLVVSQGIAPLVFRLCEILSQGDRTQHAAAIRAGKARQKKAGKYLGGPVPFGWQVDEKGRLVRDEEQQKVIVKMRKLKEDRWSYRDIAKKVEEENGLKFSHEGVRRILLKNKG